MQVKTPSGLQSRRPTLCRNAKGGHTPAHPSRKAREGWGTHLIVVRAEGWATRDGATAQLKRATITVSVPTAARTWPPVK